MSFDFNKIQLIGHLGDKPHVSYSQEGALVVSASIAVNENWKDKSGKQH